MILRLGAVLLASTLLLRASGDPGDASFTPQELAQGYREHFLLARPLASHLATIGAEEARDGIQVRRVFSRFRGLRVIALDPADTPARAIARLRATGRYAYVEPDYLRHIALAPDDPAYVDGALWNLNNTGANNGFPGADVNAPAAWDIVHDAPNVVVAVVDTGINANHRDLSPNLWQNPSPTPGINDLIGANFVGGGGNLVNGSPVDDNGHGTHVAGILGAAGNNGIAIAGIAWKVQIMAVKVFGSSGSGPVSEIVAGINYAVAHGANIINASYGESGGTGYSSAEFDAIAAARDQGILFVAAAGNATTDLDVSPVYPASFALDNIVTVGASTNRDELALFSNYGAPVDLFAPGDSIVSLNYATTTGTLTLSGTSMAAPHVSGALALLMAEFPHDTYRQLINRLLRGAAPSVNPDSTFVGQCQTGGRLDLYRALTTTTNRPFNDDFADRPQLSGDNLSIRSNNAGATAEPGEPAHAGLPATASLWWEWTAATTGTVSIDTAGSNYDTVLAVYTGTSLPALQPVAANDDDNGVTSRVTFNAVAGTAYEIAVDGKAGASGLTLLNVGTTPANDAFATPVVLTGLSASVTGSNAHCTREPGEPKIAGFAGGTSLWYQWTAPRTGQFQIAVITSNFDPLLGIYTGGSLDSLHAVFAGAGFSANGLLATFNATAGTTYSITVDAQNPATTGQFSLTLNDSVWQATTGAAVTAEPAVGPDGRVYVGSTDGTFYAYDTDGTSLWTYATGGLIDTCSAAIADDGSIYFGSNDGTFYALTHAGGLKWKHAFGPSAPVSNSPALAADGTIYVKAGDGYLYALNPADGSLKWSHNLNSPLSYASPSVAADGTVYQGSETNGSSSPAQLYALNPADGSVKWTFATPGGNDIYTVPAIDAAGNIYFGVLTTGKLYSLTSAGARRWTFAGASLGSSSSPSLSADGSTVYFAGYDSVLYAVNAATGTARWTYPLGGQVRASSPAIDANGVVYIGAYDGRLYAVNPDGTLDRTWDTANWIRSSPAIFGQMLYIGSNDHRLYAFAIGAGSATGPWPQYRQNVLRTGRAYAPPALSTQPASQTAAAGSAISLTAAVTNAPSATYQWSLNGTAIPGATAASLSLPDVEPADAGIYTVTVTSGSTTLASSPAVVGVLTTAKVVGTGTEVGSNIRHPNGNIYDQVLLTGPAATITADPGQVTRLSYIDLTDDIVQVEFAGAGSLSIVLDAPTGPAPPVNYNQPDVAYMKGHAHIVVAGADETTNLSIFTVGRATAFDPTGAYNIALPISATNMPADNGSPLFAGHDATNYDGVADLASVAILSTDGKFGGLRTADARYWASQGLTGLCAPGVEFVGPVYVENIDAHDSATPVLLLGSADTDTSITGGDLLQTNGDPVQVSGLTQLRFAAGTDSGGNLLPAQANQAVLEDNGVDVTAQIVVDPAP